MQCTVVPSPVMMLELFRVLPITLLRYGFFIKGWPKGYFASSINCHLYRAWNKLEFQLALRIGIKQILFALGKSCFAVLMT